MQPNKRAAQAEIGDKLARIVAARKQEQKRIAATKKSRRDQVRDAQTYVPGKAGKGRRGIP